jgi:hypothetical protein
MWLTVTNALAYYRLKCQCNKAYDTGLSGSHPHTQTHARTHSPTPTHTHTHTLTHAQTIIKCTPISLSLLFPSSFIVSLPFQIVITNFTYRIEAFSYFTSPCKFYIHFTINCSFPRCLSLQVSHSVFLSLPLCL